MKKVLVLFMLFFTWIFALCDKGDTLTQSGLNCKILQQGLINADDETVKNEISKLLTDLTPDASYYDETGHLLNFGILFSRIEQCDNISCHLDCYCCLQTYPPLSIVMVNTDSSGINISRIIYIRTPDNDILEYSSMKR
jgi:hypothetical protein